MFSGLFKNKQPPKRIVKQIIGRVVYSYENLVRTLYRRKNIDDSIPDYSYWDRFRNCLIDGYQLSGVLAQAINEIIASWVIGRAVSVRLASVDDARYKQKEKYTNDLLRRLFLSIQGMLVDLYQDLQALGDQFVMVNPDGGIVVISPDMVDIEYDPLDYCKPVSYTITTVLDNLIIQDKYTEQLRTLTVRKSGSSGAVVSTQTFKVLIGRFPIVHFANNKGTNEKRGHPLIETLRPIFSEYNDLLKKGLQGAKVAGNPVPVFENLFDPEETIDRMATQDDDTYVDMHGNEETRKMLRWDEQAAIVLGEGGRFRFASPPPGFSRDILAMLTQLFNIIIYRMHTPEHMWGVGLQIGKGVEAQEPNWVRFLEGRRDKFAGTATDSLLGIKASGGLHELAEVWLKTKALTDSKIFVGATIVRWSDLTEKDRSLSFEWVKWLNSRGYITGKTALEKSGLVEDIDAEYEEAEKEFQDQLAAKNLQFDDFGGTAPGAGGDTNPTTADNTTDLRKNNGASAPRAPAYGGGGKTKPRTK